MSTDKVYVGLEHAPNTFDLCSRVLGQGGANLEFIRSETGAMVILKGGAGDKMNPLHIALSHTRAERLAAARTLAFSLVESVRQEFQQWSSQNASPPNNIPPMNVPPPTLVHQPPPVAMTAPPPIVSAPQAPINIPQQQPQMLQLVPQQQIFVAQDGTHYVKVSLAQNPVTNIGPLTAVPLGQAGVNVVPQQAPVVQNYVQRAPVVEILSGTAPGVGPSICSAPTLSTPTVTQQIPQMGVAQPWNMQPQQVAAVPAPNVVQFNNVGPNNQMPQWNPAQQSNVRPWNEQKPLHQPTPANQADSLGSNLPWYKNSQNTASAPVQQKLNDVRPKITEVWGDGGNQNSAVTENLPVWQTGAPVNPKAAMPDLLEEIKKEKESETAKPQRDSRRDREYGGGRRRERRERRDRPYTDQDVYRRQFRSAGHLGDESTRENNRDEKPSNERDSKPSECSTLEQPKGQVVTQDIGYQQNDQNQFNMGAASTPTKWDRTAEQAQRSNMPTSISKWDRPNFSPANKQSPQYNQSSQYTQQSGQYNQQYPTQYQSPQQNKPSQTPQSDSQNYEKQVPTTQYVGAATNYTPAQQAQSWAANQGSMYANQANQYGSQYDQKPWQQQQQQQQHPWNRQGNEYSGGNNYAAGSNASGNHNSGPWNTTPMMPPPPPPPAIANQPNFW